MYKILQKIERIRKQGRATLKLEKNSPLFCYNGNTFKVEAIDNGGFNCRLILAIRNKKVRVTIHDVM